MKDDDLPDPSTLPKDLARLVRLARLMDTAYGIPFTRVRLGWDSLVGLIPVVGDGVTAAIGASIVLAAKRRGVPNSVITRMLGNVAVDFLIGTIPLVGDAADVFWKSHRANMKLLLKHREEQPVDAEWTPAEPTPAR